MRWPPVTPDSFFMGTELECLTCVKDKPKQTPQAIDAVLTILGDLAPSLRGPSGIFNAYGRVYPDSSHIELAVSECHSPYMVPLLVERQQLLVRQATVRLAAESGIRLVVACNNHSELLERGCAVWGAHENHTVPVHPTKFTDEILPFLVTRIYGGAGGIESPCGNFLAAVRPLCMKHATGGSTTQDRAIHSTCREEHFMGRSPDQYRYHLILGDGHRSHFNLALQFGATALAIKAVCHDRQLKRHLAKMKRWPAKNWVKLLNRLNVLQKPGQALKIDPLIVDTQRVYLDAARRYVEMLDEVPGWIPETLQDWEDTLSAMERMDRQWLAARLDTFTKYEFYSYVLANAGLSWADLPSHPNMFRELALHDHSYHDFCDDESPFLDLEQNGMLNHRVGALVLPGQEHEPFVPNIPTRARARARFIRDHADQEGRYVMDWSHVIDRDRQQIAEIHDPGATEYSEWKSTSDEEVLEFDERLLSLWRRLHDRLGPEQDESMDDLF